MITEVQKGFFEVYIKKVPSRRGKDLKINQLIIKIKEI